MSEVKLLNEWRSLRLAETELPEGAEGFCLSTKAGEYTIIINQGLTEEKKLEAFIHEMIHLYHEDHENKELTGDQIEARAHKKTRDILARLRKGL